MKKLMLAILLLACCGCTNNEISSEESKNKPLDEESNYTETNENSEVVIETYEENLIMNEEYNIWLSDTKKDEFVITIFGTTVCPHCKNLKKVINKVSGDYNLKVYFFYSNILEEDKWNKLASTYTTNYEGYVPHMFITKNGTVITNRTGELSEEELVEYLKLNLIIK